MIIVSYSPSFVTRGSRKKTIKIVEGEQKLLKTGKTLAKPVRARQK
jgi:hypothetical protein